jgi:hypothetical protein
MSQMYKSPSSPPDASKWGDKTLNSKPRTAPVCVCGFANKAAPLSASSSLMSLAGFQRWMEPSARPPAMTPRGNSSCKLLPPIAPKVPHDKRLKRSAVTQELSTGRSNSVLAKSSLSNSKLADELKLRSMAPAIVPTAIICAIGANATVADLWIDFNAIFFSPASTHHSPSPPLHCTHSLSLFLLFRSFSDLCCSHPDQKPTNIPHTN